MENLGITSGTWNRILTKNNNKINLYYERKIFFKNVRAVGSCCPGSAVVVL